MIQLPPDMLDLDLVDVAKQLDAAGVAHKALGISGEWLHTYDDDGMMMPLADTAKIVLASYKKPPPVVQPDMNSDTPTDNATVLQIVVGLRAYLQLPNATITPQNNAQALKALIRLAFFMFKRLIVLR